MSEFQPGTAQDVTAGALLRQAREAAGLHVSTLAANLKVPVRKLEALEEDRYDLLPDAVFVRALASSVCRTLKVDPQPILERLPQTPHPRLAQDRDGINAPFRPAGDVPRGGWLDQVSRPVVLAVALLLVGALVVVLLPAREDLSEQAQTAADPAMPPGTQSDVTAGPAEAGAESASAATAVAIAPAAATAGSAPVATALAAARPASAALAAASAPAAAASAPLPGDGIVAFRTTGGSSWVSVTDARGHSVLRRLMEPGETASASGALPLSVTVGNMSATEVQVRGQPFNMGSVARDNVARFEVK